MGQAGAGDQEPRIAFGAVHGGDQAVFGGDAVITFDVVPNPASITARRRVPWPIACCAGP